MQKMTNIEVQMTAEKRYTRSIAGEGLNNGKKIALEVYRLFKAESLRRKGLESKLKRKRKAWKVKSEPPNI